jgi:hypothetical protein
MGYGACLYVSANLGNALEGSDMSRYRKRKEIRRAE